MVNARASVTRGLRLGCSHFLLLCTSEAFQYDPRRGISFSSPQPPLFGVEPAQKLPPDCRRIRNVALQESSNDEDENTLKDDNDGVQLAKGDLTWLRNAMASSASSSTDSGGLLLLDTKPGIAGFSLDKKLGFCAILIGDNDRATYAIVSSQDKQRVQSAEAHCLVQLAGGIDLGTPILPPDILARLVAEELEDKEQVQQEVGDSSVTDLRRRVKLLRVDVDATEHDLRNGKEDHNESPAMQSTPEREAVLDSQAPKVAAAVSKLAGLRDCTVDDVRAALQRHADEKGSLDRTAFMDMLGTLRNSIQQPEASKVQFELVVAVHNMKDDEPKTVDETIVVVPTTSPMYALGLALRYKVDVVLSKQCQVEGFDVVEIASKFPEFRPIQELYDDAKIMDGFIPSMFNQATSPPENDDKT